MNQALRNQGPGKARMKMANRAKSATPSQGRADLDSGVTGHPHPIAVRRRLRVRPHRPPDRLKRGLGRTHHVLDDHLVQRGLRLEHLLVRHTPHHVGEEGQSKKPERRGLPKVAQRVRQPVMSHVILSRVASWARVRLCGVMAARRAAGFGARLGRLCLARRFFFAATAHGRGRESTLRRGRASSSLRRGGWRCSQGRPQHNQHRIQGVRAVKIVATLPALKPSKDASSNQVLPTISEPGCQVTS